MMERYEDVGSKYSLRRRPASFEFRLVEIDKRLAKVHQHQIALVPDQRKKRGLPLDPCSISLSTVALVSD